MAKIRYGLKLDIFEYATCSGQYRFRPSQTVQARPVWARPDIKPVVMFGRDLFSVAASGQRVGGGGARRVEEGQNLEKVEVRRVGAQNFAFLPLSVTCSLCSSLSWRCLLVVFWWCLKRWDPQVHTLGVLGVFCGGGFTEGPGEGVQVRGKRNKFETKPLWV